MIDNEMPYRYNIKTNTI